MDERAQLLESNVSHAANVLSRKTRDNVKAGMSFLDIFRSGLIAPNETTYGSLSILLNEDDPDRKDRLTEQWRDHKLQELNFIGIVGALLAGVLTSTGSWPTVLANGNRQPWAVRAFWFSGVIFALFSVLIAAQQTLRLHRLSGHRDGLVYIRSCMSGRVDHNGQVKPRRAQVYAWQASIVLLTAAVLCMVIGITILVWISTNWGPYKNPREQWWDENAKLAVTFTVVLIVTVTIFLVAQASLAVGFSNSDDR
ncbi:hypothetical protein JX265_001121 [Neoarthrinium moseri]|uniref:Uncharacterized protein n=1 Tax=Neoarthrinium moseri TaxID=1658444 RepID=A0A9P9WXI9_9PEZI|nr:uncharacterized protein JN550_004606 [Neoarthrinium moseri]KAI1843827.1 hypothetical protein JX266_010086 [Neoarthrinium moseri]KAI1871161.1 hypothetical protein JN550_004606 [Neoarthrinium moseri]KAI1880881.1 hypothetical protein JX265_001121 [Neoarthrinium moseri]